MSISDSDPFVLTLDAAMSTLSEVVWLSGSIGKGGGMANGLFGAID
jgi:hypothetical protein